MIEDGTLPCSWEDIYVINAVQLDACTLGLRLGCKKKKALDYRCMEDNATNSKLPRCAEFSTETDGHLCHQWNWGMACGFMAMHWNGT